MRTVLVTGGAGFIGSNFVHYLLGQAGDVRVINLDVLTYAGRPENLHGLPRPEAHTFVQGDINDRALLDSLFSQYAIDIVVHFAAESHVDRSILDPGGFVQTNIVGTYNLLEAARQAWRKADGSWRPGVRFHHVSTDEVYGSLAADDPAWTESTAYAPNSPYSASKASSDHLVRAYGHTFGLPFTLTNCTNNYGPRQFPEKLIPLMILNALEGKPLPVYGDGGQIRDWLHVQDHCEAIWQVIEHGRSGETYNIGGNNQPTNLTVINTLCNLIDELAPQSGHAPHAQLIKFVTDRPGHDRRYAMDIGKMQRELGWSPRFDLASGLRQTVQWYLNHPEWVQAVRSEAGYQGWLERNYARREGK